jgi:hypothetical protein
MSSGRLQDQSKLMNGQKTYMSSGHCIEMGDSDSQDFRYQSGVTVVGEQIVVVETAKMQRKAGWVKMGCKGSKLADG